MLQKFSQKVFLHNLAISLLLLLLAFTYLNLFWLNKPADKELSPPKKIPKISLLNLSKLQETNSKIQHSNLINPFLITKSSPPNNPVPISVPKPQAPASILTLQGTIISPQQSVALIAFAHKTYYYHLNDNFEHYILQDIRPKSVVLYNQLTNNLETLNLKD